MGLFNRHIMAKVDQEHSAISEETRSSCVCVCVCVGRGGVVRLMSVKVRDWVSQTGNWVCVWHREREGGANRQT